MIQAKGLLIFLTTLQSVEGSHWKYGETDQTGYGPDDWHIVWKHCSGRAQSPINIRTNTAQNDPHLGGLRFTSDNENGKVSGKLTNNGHAPTLAISKVKGTASMTGGPLGDGVYKLEQFHFHFGCKKDQGSEHTVNGDSYSGELHLVTYNTKYPDFSTAADKEDGLSVIGIFLKGKEGDDDDDDDIGNPELRVLACKMRRIQKAGASVAVQKVSLYNLISELEDLSKASFYSYKGSLTTPPCYESVRWIVLKTPIDASKKDLRAMRRLRDHEEHSICNNFRLPQPLNGRIVTKYEG